jgi:hypothetical protein
MLSDLDILGVLNPIKYPSFPPAAKTLAVLASLRYICLVYSGGLHEEER